MSDTKALTTATDNAHMTALRQQGLGIPQGLGLSDLVVPRLGLLQRMSRDLTGDRRPGVFADNVGSAPFTERRITILKIDRRRRNWPMGADRPICWSDDGLVPSPRVEEPISDCHACEVDGQPQCSAAKWRKDVGADCRKYYEYVIVDDQGNPYTLQLTGSAVKVAKAANTKATGGGTLPLEWHCLLSVKTVSGAKGEYFVPSFSDWQRHDPADTHVATYQQLCGGNIADSVPAETDDIPF